MTCLSGLGWTLTLKASGDDSNSFGPKYGIAYPISAVATSANHPCGVRRAARTRLPTVCRFFVSELSRRGFGPDIAPTCLDALDRVVQQCSSRCGPQVKASRRSFTHQIES